MSDIWTLDKRPLPIDTILNNFDISKLYLHKFYKPLKKKDGKTFDYASHIEIVPFVHPMSETDL